ncbi:hypothetical protein GW17_00008403 [Ensete ventricosum]|nr:hypothetical protein GW17_00008403 [Ensete ventricosum]
MVETRRSSAAAAAGKRCPAPPSRGSAVSPSAKRSKVRAIFHPPFVPHHQILISAGRFVPGIFQVEAGAPPPNEKEPVDLDEPSLVAQDDGVVAKSTSPDISLTVEIEVDGPLGLSGQVLLLIV